MQYLLTLYVDESGWGKMTSEQQQQGLSDLDAAMSWAGRCPAAQHGVVEVRAIRAM